VVAERPDFAAISDELGMRWELLNNAYKPYPCGVVLNPVIDACLALAGDARIADGGWQRIARIELTGHPLLRQRTDRPGVTTGRQSQVSAQHAVPVVLARGRAGLAEFSDAAVADPALRALGAKLVFRDDPAMSIDAVRLRVALEDGAECHHDITAARGSLSRPLEDRELEAKLRELRRYGNANVDVDRLIDVVWSLDTAEDAAVAI